MYNFFIKQDNKIDNTIIIKGENYNHIKNVLRLKENDKIQICVIDTEEVYLVEIHKISQEEIQCNIIKKLQSNESKIKITVFQGIPKTGKMENIIQKSVELGAYCIVPVKMEYCIGKINNEDKKIKRWQAISESAAKQSKRTIIPKVEVPITMKELIAKLKMYDIAIVAYECENETTLKNELQKNTEIKNIAIIIGPEGGISDKEINELTENGAISVSLGKRILRTETASTALLSMILYEYEL